METPLPAELLGCISLDESNTSENDDRANIKIAKLPDCFQVNLQCFIEYTLSEIKWQKKKQ